MNKFKRCALFLRNTGNEGAEYQYKLLHDYADSNNFIVTVTVTLSNEQDMLADRSDYDVILTCDTILLPIAGAEIIKIN